MSVEAGKERSRVSGVDELRIAHAYLAQCGVVGAMIDVGTRSGSGLRPFLEEGWRVHAFDPDPVNRPRLEALMKAYPLLVADFRAVSDATRKAVPFYTSPVSKGISSLLPFHESHEEANRVDTITLADYCREKAIETVDLLKTDTEGYDLPVLRGFPWDTIRPRVVVSEFEDKKTEGLGYTFRDMAEFLTAHGYEIVVSEWYPIRKYGEAHAWRGFRRYPCELSEEASWGNVLAVRDGVDEELLLNAVARALGSSLAEVDDRAAAARRELAECRRREEDLAARLDAVERSRAYRLARTWWGLRRRED